MKKLNSLEARDKGFHQFKVREEPYTIKIYLDNMSFYNNNDIKDKITIIKTIEFEDIKEGIAILNRNLLNKATIELVKEIENKYKQN